MKQFASAWHMSSFPGIEGGYGVRQGVRAVR
jgi:hypothetical protein